MAMVSTHGAPQVTYPAGRWRFYPYLLALVWLLQLGVGIAAYAVGDRTSWPLLWAMLGLGWLGVGLYVGCSPSLFSTGALTWAGEPTKDDSHTMRLGWHWYPAANTTLAHPMPCQTDGDSVQVSCIWRMNTHMLLAIDVPSTTSAAPRRWLWLSAADQPASWRALCRAVTGHARVTIA